MSISMRLYDLRFFATMHLKMDYDLLGELPLGAMLQGLEERLLPCWLAASSDSYLETLQLSIGAIESLVVEGYLSSDLKAIVNSVGERLFQDFEQDMMAALPNIFQTTVRESVNNLLVQYAHDYGNSTACLADPSLARDDVFVDFRNLLLGSSSMDDESSSPSPYGTYLQSGYQYLQDTFFTSEGVANINRLVGSWTKDQSSIEGAVIFLEEGLNITTSFSVGNLVADARVNVWNASIQNINSLGMPFVLGFPSTPYTLDSNLSVGADSRALTLGANLLMTASDGGKLLLQIIYDGGQIYCSDFPFVAKQRISCLISYYCFPNQPTWTFTMRYI
jgi:hypothetical protein